MTTDRWLIIFGAAIATFIPRVIPMLFFKNKEIPPKVTQWLSFIPVTIFSALVFSDLVFWENNLSFNPLVNLKMIPSLIVFFIAYKTKNIFISMIIGIVAISLMLLFF
ncbi:MAG: AzlD domain-containing protein [Saccharofermentanales bacterium]|jgi:branched-subunit amino acid transport protein